MRRRIVLVTIAVALVSVVVLGLPLAILAARQARDEASSRLARAADGVGLVAEREVARGRLPASEDLRPVVGADRYVEVRSPIGTVTYGTRPTGSTIRSTLQLESSVVVDVLQDASDLRDAITLRTSVVIGVSLASIVTAVVLSIVLAKQITRPLQRLVEVAERMGSGDFTASAPPSGLGEIDSVTNALQASGERIAKLVRAEREFSANASHQLRTPLTAMRMRLEEISTNDDLVEVRDDAVAALGQADRLEATINELLALARTGRASPPTSVDMVELVQQRVTPWRAALAARGRQLQLDLERPCVAHASDGAVRQALEILVDNATRHGAGTIRIELQRRGELVELRVSDEGKGIRPGMEQAIFDRHVSADATGSGLGLHIARVLLQADGARLDLARARPAEFAIRLPAEPGR